MKHLLLLFILICLGKVMFGQYVYTIKADSVKLTSCDSSELIIENHTQAVPGFLFNTGNGRTVFKRGVIKINDSFYLIGGDTLKMPSNSWVQGGNRFGATGVLGTLDNNHLDFYTNNLRRVRIDSLGNFGLDVTANQSVPGLFSFTNSNGGFKWLSFSAASDYASLDIRPNNPDFGPAMQIKAGYTSSIETFAYSDLSIKAYDGLDLYGGYGGGSLKYIRFFPGNAGAAGMFSQTGNFILGDSVDRGKKLQVYGTGLINNYSFINGVDPYSYEMSYGGAGIAISSPYTHIFNAGGSAGGISFGFNRSYATGRYLALNQYLNGSGTVNAFEFTPVFNNSSTAVGSLNLLNLSPTWNVTGVTDTSVARGIFYNPTITSLTRTRHIAFENTVGDVLLGSSSGNVIVGSTASNNSMLQVNGFFSQRYTNTASFGNGLLFDIAPYNSVSTSRIFSSGEIAYQSNYSGDQHIFENSIGAGFTGTLVTLDPGYYPLLPDNQLTLKVLGRSGNLGLVVNMLGNAGIGTLTPSAQLHTTGTVRFAGLTSDTTQTRVLVSDASGNLYYRAASTLAGNGILSADLANGSAILPSLAVNGTISAQRMKLSQTGWPDYVFGQGYRLPRLNEIEEYIQQHGHLPGIPSAAEVEKKGIDVGDQEKALLKKIEELTLYTIEQDKKLATQVEQLDDLKKEVAELKKMITNKK